VVFNTKEFRIMAASIGSDFHAFKYLGGMQPEYFGKISLHEYANFCFWVAVPFNGGNPFIEVELDCFLLDLIQS
jgi:hypothetical protein